MSAKTAWKAEYRRWTGKSAGVWTRRAAIARYGLRLCLKGKIARAFLFLALMQTVVLAAVFFFFGQIVAPDSSLVNWLEDKSGGAITTYLNAITSWMLLYPEICVDGVYRVLFYLMRFSGPFFSMIMVALFIHRLIAGDVASNAIVIYNSKALTRADYMLGKFGVVAPILAVIWIVPVVVSWILGNILSPDWSFFWHTLPSLLRGVAVGVAAVISLSCIAMAVSAVAGRSRAAVAYWILGWIVMSIVGSVASLAHESLALINPIACIEELAAGVYRIDLLWRDAQDMLPFFSGFVSDVDEDALQVPATLGGGVWAPLLILTAMSFLSLYVVDRRIRQS